MSLREELDPEFIANSVIMDTHSGYYILVEGDSDDSFYSKFLNDAICQIEICNGKENALNVLEIINSHGAKEKKTIAIVDKDFDFLHNNTVPSNLIKTDFHDIEMMCIQSDSFAHFGREYFSTIKLNKLLHSTDILKLKEHLLNLCVPLAKVRIFNHVEKLNLAFKSSRTKPKELDYKKFICKNEFTFKGYPILIDAIRTYYNQGVNIDAKDFEKKIHAVNIVHMSLYDICSGHDVTQIIAIGLLKKISKSNMPQITTEEIERALRISFTIADFNKTNLKVILENIDPQILKAA